MAHTSATPYIAVVTLTCKPVISVLVSGGIDGKLRISLDYCQSDSDNKDTLEFTSLDIVSSITSMIAIENSPLIAVGTSRGEFFCIHVGSKKSTTSSKTKISATVITKEKTPNKKISLLAYQSSTKKLAMGGLGESSLSIVCMEPNNMKIIGVIQISESNKMSALSWSNDDFRLIVGNENGLVTCYNVLGMTFEHSKVDCLWTKKMKEVVCQRGYAKNETGDMFLFDLRNGIYCIDHSILSGDCSSNDDEIKSKCLWKDDPTPTTVGFGSCIFATAGTIILGSQSGDVSIFNIAEKEEGTQIVSSGSYHACPVGSLCLSAGGTILSSGVDGTIFAHKLTKSALGSQMKTSMCSTSLQWDYLLPVEMDGFAMINSETNDCEGGGGDESIPELTSQLKLLRLSGMQEIRRNMSMGIEEMQTKGFLLNPNKIQNNKENDKLDIVFLQLERATMVEHTLKSSLSVTGVLVNIEVGDHWLSRNLFAKHHDFVIVGSQAILSLKESISSLVKQSDILNLQQGTLQKEISELKWNNRLFHLRVADASEECDDWNFLRVTSHLKKTMNGAVDSEEKFVATAVEKLTRMQGMHEAQLQKSKRDTVRYSNEIKQKERENNILHDQMKAVRANIIEREKIFHEITKVRAKKQGLEVLGMHIS